MNWKQRCLNKFDCINRRMEFKHSSLGIQILLCSKYKQSVQLVQVGIGMGLYNGRR